MVAKSYALATGIFVVVLGVALTLVAIWIGGYDKELVPYVVIAEQSVSGLEAQSTVYYRGVAGGHVSVIRIDPDDPRRILVEIRVERDLPITRSTYATLRHKLVTGDASLELGDSFEQTEPLETREADPATIPMRESQQLGDLLAQGQVVLAEVSTVVGTARELLDQVEGPRLRQIVVNLEELTAGLPRLQEQTARALQAIPALGDKAQGTLRQVDGLVAELQTTAGQLTRMVRSMADLAAQGERAGTALLQQTLPRVGEAFEEIESSAAAMRQLARSLQNNPQQLLYGESNVPLGPGESREDGRMP